MTVPVFEEYEPARDCSCPGCAQQRRDLARGLPVRAGGHPAAHGARRALVLATAAGIALSATGAGVAQAAGPSAGPPPGPLTGQARMDAAPGPVLDPAPGPAPDDGGRTPRPAAEPGADPVEPGAEPIVEPAPEPGPESGVAPVGDPAPSTPQGGSGPLNGQPLPGPGSSRPVLRKSTRAEIINRAKRWVNAKVPYNMEKYWSDGYRQDCSGYVSMAWNLAGNEWTGSLAQYGVKITREELEPGDILLFHNPSDPNKGSHVTIFGGWTDYTHSYYVAYEQTPPSTRSQSTPMAYWNNSAQYVPYRYKGLTEQDPGGGGSGPGAETGERAAYPGAGSFGPGADNAYVRQLGEMLVERGGRRFYSQGPGPRWGEADRRATQAFQRAQGWRGADADGLPGPNTWRYLVDGLGKDIPPAGAGGSGASGRATTRSERGAGGGSGSRGDTGTAPAFPGARYFRPGAAGPYVERLGRQLVKKGFGRHYTSGPGARWTEADRRNVEAFQHAQGWRGTEADGYPGPHTWRRLFA
ncbi:peptidoglycan-binding protein [Streptomyces sp. NPDC051569]|uniref:peptidoglycan-binding protein n=1 Tax=Streptomyces sp. NPDC051569 TaxID=3365661 RepID=UPI00378B5C5A